MKKTFLSTLFSTFLLFGAFGQKSTSDSIQTKINILNLTVNQDQQETAILQKDLGMAYYQDNELYYSFEAFEKAAHMFKNLQDTNKESECLHMMGNVSYFLDNYNDAIQFYVILRNLINNAIKFSDNGGIISLDAYEKDNQLVI